jgi:hypothetical protein
MTRQGRTQDTKVRVRVRVRVSVRVRVRVRFRGRVRVRVGVRLSGRVNHLAVPCKYLAKLGSVVGVRSVWK